jgi:hypothetical protein
MHEIPWYVLQHNLKAPRYLPFWDKCATNKFGHNKDPQSATDVINLTRH